MNERKFLMMTPRERDWLVAEKVMGFDLVQLQDVPDELGPTHFWKEHLDGTPVLYYTTDISAAWEVVEKMRSNGFWVGLNSLVDTPDMNWRCEIRGLRAMWEPVWGAAPTAPLAICIAALKAVGEIECTL